MKKLKSLFSFLAIALLLSSAVPKISYADDTGTVNIPADTVVTPIQVFDTIKVTVNDTVVYNVTPDFINIVSDAIPNSTGSVWGTLACIYLGFFIYFYLLYKDRKDKDNTFTIKIWWRDNKSNFIIYLIAIFFMYWKSGVMHPISAISIGLAGNVIIDKVQRFITKK